MELRNLKLKEQYRSDRDDIISEFLIPCLNNCIQYDRTVEFVTLRGLTCLLYTSPSPRDRQKSRMPSSA